MKTYISSNFINPVSYISRNSLPILVHFAVKSLPTIASYSIGLTPLLNKTIGSLLLFSAPKLANITMKPFVDDFEQQKFSPEYQTIHLALAAALLAGTSTDKTDDYAAILGLIIGIKLICPEDPMKIIGGTIANIFMGTANVAFQLHKVIGYYQDYEE